jgi:L-amino acid N-acyltransferase YncA
VIPRIVSGVPLRILPAAPHLLADWRAIHNEIIPTNPLTEEDVAKRAARYVLSVALADESLVGCATVRPPEGGSDAATVIVRILPAFRRRGMGSEYLQHALAAARARGACEIETVVLATNEEGLRFARSHGFIERNRYTVDGQSVPFIDLHLGRSLDP